MTHECWNRARADTAASLDQFDTTDRHTMSTPDSSAADPLRADPLRVRLDVESIFADFGLDLLYEDAASALGQRVDLADEALFEAVATDAERDRLEASQSVIPLLGGPYRGQAIALHREGGEIVRRVQARAAQRGHPLAATLAQARRAVQAVDELWERDLAAYREAYGETVRRLLSDRGASVEVEIVDHSLEQRTDLAIELEDAARKATPLPMSGAVPDWTRGTPADALRRAGLTYLDRVGCSPLAWLDGSAGEKRSRHP